jgi:serine/threonine protein kinase
LTVTGCRDEKLYEITNASQYDFIDSVFQTNEGKELQKLIENLVQDDPEARISLEEASMELIRIESEIQQNEEVLKFINKLKAENIHLLNLIERHSFGDNDEYMEDFINKNIELINKSINPDELATLRIRLEIILKDQKAVEPVKSIILNLRIRSSCINKMNTKANKIEQELCNTPVEERGNMMDIDTQLGRKVHMLIASHSCFTFIRPFKLFGHEVDENKQLTPQELEGPHLMDIASSC